MKTDPDPIALLKELVAFPTVSHRPVSAIAAALAQRAEDAGGRTELLASGDGKCNVIARFGPPSTDGIVLSGHMDVVPTEGQDWTSDPFKLVEREGRLFGRGSADMKGFIAAVTTALPQLPIHQLKRELVLIWTHDEEVGCLGSQHLADQWADHLGPLPSQAWIGEPTDLKMCRMHPGHSTIEICCLGRAAHSSRPGLGINAIQLAQQVLTALEALAESWRQNTAYETDLVCPFTVMNVGQIHGGTAVNIVPDRCVITVGIRPLPGADTTSHITEIKDALRPAARHAQALGGSIGVEALQVGPALLTPAGTRLERHLCPHAAADTATAAPFATDGGNLARLGISSIVFGPGSIDVAHRADEFIPVSQLVACVETVRSVVHQLCTENPVPA
jgi:acetylornithine deacetylase